MPNSKPNPRPGPCSLELGDLSVHLIPILQNNVAYLLVRGDTVVAVDPGEAAPILTYLKVHRLTLTDIWITHGHHDHIGGLDDVRAVTQARLTAPPGLGLSNLDRAVGEGDLIPFGPHPFRVWFTPGHYPVHVAYIRETSEQGPAFIGDILFGAGCGRLFGHPPHLLFQSLQRLNTLPPTMPLFCGHDLAEQNLLFAQSIEPGNVAVQERLAKVRRQAVGGKPSLPITLHEERATNPFLRVEERAMREGVGLAQARALEVFAELRRRKDNF